METLVVLLLKYLQILRSTYEEINKYWSLFAPLRIRNTEYYCIMHSIPTNHRLSKSEMQAVDKKQEHLGMRHKRLRSEESIP